MSEFHKTASKHFPKLRSNALRLYAFNTWAGQYPEGIRRITLYKCSSTPQKYSVVFEVISDICKADENALPLITDSFSKIYREKPNHNFKDDWIFFVKLLYKESPYLSVNPQNSLSSTFKPKLEDDTIIKIEDPNKSEVCITHLPTGLEVTCQGKKPEEITNKNVKILYPRILNCMIEENKDNLNIFSDRDPHIILCQNKNSEKFEAEEAFDIAVEAGPSEEDLESIKLMAPKTIDDHYKKRWVIKELKSELRPYENYFGTKKKLVLNQEDKVEVPQITKKDNFTNNGQDKTTDQNDIPTIVFYKDGDFWKIGEKGSEKTLNHLKGFGYIAFLIRNKNHSFTPLEVYNFGKVPDEDKHLNEVDFQKIGNSSELKKHIKYLEEKLAAETNQDKRDELNHNISELRKIKNEGFKAFKQKSDSCRTNVYKLIQTAAKKIQKELPTLKEYFNYGQSKVIKTGKEFSYQQFNFGLSVNWILEIPS